MSYIAEISITHPDLPLSPTISELPDHTIKKEPQPISDRRKPTVFYSVRRDQLDSFESGVTEDHTVTSWEAITDLNSRHLYRTTLSAQTETLVLEVTDLGTRFLMAENEEEGWAIRLYTPDKAIISAIQDYCTERGIAFTVEKLHSTEAYIDLGGEAGIILQLTDRQQEVAKTAAEMGYFDPEGASAEEIAGTLDIAQSTLSVHLRKITAKLFQEIFAE